MEGGVTPSVTEGVDVEGEMSGYSPRVLHPDTAPAATVNEWNAQKDVHLIIVTKSTLQTKPSADFMVCGLSARVCDTKTHKKKRRHIWNCLRIIPKVSQSRLPPPLKVSK